MRGGLTRLGLAMVAALAIAAVPAEAAKKGKKPAKLKTRTETAVTVGGTGDARVVPACPPDLLAVSGGFATRPALFAAPNPRLVVIYVNSPISDAEWQVFGQEFFGVGGEPLTGYVYCERFKGRATAVAHDVMQTTIAGGATIATATCPKGFRVLSGGWVMNPPGSGNAAIVTRSMRTGPRDWTVEATRLSGSGPMILVSQAVCGAAKRAKSGERSTTVPVTGPVGASFTATSPPCPKRAPAKAGGFATPPMPTGLLNGALVYEHLRAGRSWVTSAAASNNATAASLTSIGYCRR